MCQFLTNEKSGLPQDMDRDTAKVEYIIEDPSGDDAGCPGMERDSPIYREVPMTAIVLPHVLEARPARAPLFS